MTLRIKTLLIISGVLAALLLVVYCALRPLVMHEFARVERTEATTQMKNARRAIEQLGDKQAVSLRSWSTSDSLYNWMIAPDRAQAERMFNPAALGASGLDMVAILDKHKRLMWASAYKTNPGSSSERTPLPSELRQYFPSIPSSSFEEKPFNGFIEVQGEAENNSDARELVWVASLPIESGASDASSLGTLVLGKKVDLASELAGLGQLSTVKLRGELSAQERATLENAVSQKDDGATVNGWINDVSNRPIALLEFTADNTASTRGEIALNAFGLVLVGCGLFSLMAAMVPLEKLVLSPLAGLNGFIDDVRGSGDLSRRIGVQGDDEISHLSTNINATFATLQIFTNRLRHSENLFREMAQTGLGSGDAFFVLSQNSDELEWHGDIDSLLGYEPGGLPRTWSAWLEHIFLNDKGRVGSACSRAFVRREVITVEFRVIRCDGSKRHWLLRGKALLPKSEGENIERPAGESLKMVGVCIDISERKAAEEELRSSRERLERIVETAADAIVIADANGQITDVNRAAEDVFGLTREEMRERTFDDPLWKVRSLDGSPFPPDESPFARVKLLGTPIYKVQYGVEDANARRLTLSVNAAPLVDSRGHFSGMVALVSDVTEQHAMEVLYKRHAHQDFLTGLVNRARLKDRLQHALSQRGREENAVAVLFVDLDNFKYINDSLGHQAGDEMLVLIARRLESSLRAGDTAARFGGDEFVILLEQMEGPHYAITVAERLLEALREPFPIEGREVFTTPSIGIAFSHAGHNNPNELLRQADAALYEAKRRGKARYEIYQSHLGEGARKRLQIENDLRRALQKHEFSLRFQPKWDLMRNQLAGFEALVRWEHPERGVVPPGDFIPIAEETGLIAPLGMFVLREACYQAQKWSMSHGLPLTMAVNVSPHQLRLGRHVDGQNMKSIVDSVSDVLHETGFPPGNLILEITESAIVEHTGETLETLNALKELGVSLAIDDFGTGYSALAYLRDFPFDYLKIDRQFVAKINDPGGNTVIVTSMISLAHALDLKVIAEGVEDMHEAAHLKTLSCDMGQGYFFARPLTSNDVESRFGFDFDILPTPIPALALSS